MIKFFNKMRMKLLSESKFSRYLLYAIGEIILVVIGILIALQVNNWNQERHHKETQAKYLTQLLEETKADSIFFQSRLDLFQSQTTCYSRLMQLCEGTLSDSLLTSIPTRLEEPFIMAASGSATLKSIAQDGEKISDPTIKQSVRHYEQRYEFVTSMMGVLNDDVKLYGRDLLVSHPQLSAIDVALTEYKVFCDEEDFIGILELLMEDIRDSQKHVESFMTANERLTQDINEYLESNQ